MWISTADAHPTLVAQARARTVRSCSATLRGSAVPRVIECVACLNVGIGEIDEIEKRLQQMIAVGAPVPTICRNR